MYPAVVWFRARRAQLVALTVWLIAVPLSAHAEGQAAPRDLGDILLKKGVITPEELLKTSQKGSTNVTGSIVRFDYELFSNFQLTAKSMFINALDPSIATTTNGRPLIGNPTLTRLQLDAQLKF